MKTLLLALLALSLFAQDAYIVKEDMHDVYFENEGNVEAVSRAMLSSQTTGVVTCLKYDVGDSFKKGDILLKISSLRQFASVKEATFDVDNARLDAEEKKRKYERIQRLDEQKLAKDEDLTASRTEYLVAEQTVSLKQEKLARLNKIYSYTTIIAPFDGVVEKRYVKKSERIAINSPLFDLYSKSEMRVNVSVPESIIKKIKDHKKILVKIQDESYEIPYENLTIFPTSYNYAYSLRITVPEKIASAFNDGNFVNVRFKVDEERAIYLSKEYIHEEYETFAVYEKSENGTYSQFVRLGESFEDKVKILSGLSNGDRLVLHEK